MADQNQDDVDVEFAAMQTVYRTLKPLDEEAQGRVLNYVVSRLEIALKAPSRAAKQSRAGAGEDEEDADDTSAGVAPPSSFGSFAELHDAAQPKSNAEKALVAGYWLQVCEGAESFDSQSANSALKNLGVGLVNVTSAIDSLKGQKPALALQLKKSGKTRQARKVYKITVAGIKTVENMIGG